MADEASILRILLRFGVDPESLAAAKAGVNSGAAGVTAGLKATEDQAKRTKEQLHQLKSAGRELSQVGREIGLVGAAIGGPLLLAAKSFVDANQKTSYIARQWLADTKAIDGSYQRIGGVVAKEMLPALDSAAKLVDKLASFAEKNPQLIKATLGLGAGLVGTGAVLAIAGQSITTAANIGLLVTALNKLPAVAAAGGVAGVLGSAAVVGSAGAAAGIAGGAATGYALTAALGVQAAQGGSQLAQGFQAATEALRLFVNRVTGLNYQIEGHNALGGVNGVYGPPAPVTQMYSGGAQRTADQTVADKAAGAAGDRRAAGQVLFGQYQAQKADNLLAYIDNRTKILDDYQKTYWDNEANYAQTRGRSVRDFEQAEKQAQQSFNTSRVRQLRDFAEAEQTDEKNYYANRLKQAATFNTETVRAEQDHQDALLKLQDDHADRARDLAAAGDALGFVKEQRNYEKARGESEKQYQTETARRNQDYATTLADDEAAFRDQRDQRLAAFEQSQRDQADDFKQQQSQSAAQQRQRLADMDHDFREQQDKLSAQKVQALADLDKNYAKETAHITKAFTDALTAIDPVLTGMTKTAEENFQKTSVEFGKFLDGLGNQTTGGPGYCQPGWHWDPNRMACVVDTPIHYGSAAGGYVGYGMRLLGEQGTEFVLSNSTTSAAERLAGGPLTQEKILASLSGGGNSYSVNLGGVSGHWSDRATALEGVIGLVDAKITEAFSQFYDDVGS